MGRRHNGKRLDDFGHRLRLQDPDTPAQPRTASGRGRTWGGLTYRRAACPPPRRGHAEECQRLGACDREPAVWTRRQHMLALRPEDRCRVVDGADPSRAELGWKLGDPRRLHTWVRYQPGRETRCAATTDPPTLQEQTDEGMSGGPATGRSATHQCVCVHCLRRGRIDRMKQAQSIDSLNQRSAAGSLICAGQPAPGLSADRVEGLELADTTTDGVLASMVAQKAVHAAWAASGRRTQEIGGQCSSLGQNFQGALSGSTAATFDLTSPTQHLMQHHTQTPTHVGWQWNPQPDRRVDQ